MNDWVDLLVNEVMVWLGALIGLLAFVIYVRQLRVLRGTRRYLAVMVLLTGAWMTAGYVVLGANLATDEPTFVTVWMRPGGIMLLALIAAMGINERRKR